MTDKEALAMFARNGELDQLTIKQLFRSGLIIVDDITTIDCEEQRFLKATAITPKGQKLLEG